MSPRLLIRLTALALVLIALFDPIWTRASRKVQVLFAVDISHSVDPDSLAQSLAWLASAEERDSRTRYLAFADQARVVDDLDQLRSLPVTDEPGSGPEGALARDRTDLGAALDAATVELGGEAIRRLVLLSDGRTDGGVGALDSGAWSTGGWSSGGNGPGADSKGGASSTAVDRGLLESAVELVRSGIRVDVVPLESSLRTPAISLIALGGEPRAKAPLPVAVQVISPSARGARIRIVSSGAGGERTLYERDIDLVAGKQVVPALVRLPEPGRAELTALLDGEVQWRQQVAIGESPRVLLVAGAPGGPLRGALSAQGWQVRQVSPETMTTSRQELAGYDATVLSNVAAGRLDTARMELISDWVIEDGGGLLFASGDATFGEEGYSDSPLEAILPLRFNVEEERTDVALMVALDKSYSMKGPKIELAKEATKAALGELDERHRFGVVAFDWEPYEVVPLDSVRNRERMLESISRIEASAQTNFYPALESCLRQLAAVEAEVKHVILLSDGKTYPDDYEGLIGRMREADITVSTVGVGSEADRELLADIARWGNGQTYYVQDAKRVQRILLDEARGKLEETMVEEPVRAVSVRASQALTGVDFARAPTLSGHLNLEPRQDSEVVVETDTGKPLLARRNVGLGRTWMFTSDLESRWSAGWVRWAGFGPLWSQVLFDAAAREPERGLDLDLERRGDLVLAELRAIDDQGRTRNGLRPALRTRVTEGDAERVIETELRQTGAGRYQGELELATAPDHAWAVELLLDGDVRAVRSIYYPVVDELRPGLARPQRLEILSRATGGIVRPTLDQIFEPGRATARRRIALWPWLVGLALLLYLLELALRRLGLWGTRPEALALGQPPEDHSKTAGRDRPRGAGAHPESPSETSSWEPARS